MKPKKIGNNLKLMSGDVDAILCALDLVANSDAGSSKQNQLNELNCKIAAQKLLNHMTNFTANEIRVIQVGICFALDLISGVGNPYISMDELDSEWQSDLRKNFFVYSRLYPQFSELVAEYERYM